MATRTTTKKNPDDYFSGRKAKWLPLFRRLLARLDRHSGIAISMRDIKITTDGLNIGLALQRAAIGSPRLKPSRSGPKRITHRVMVSSASEIDEELLEWLKASSSRARSAKRRST